MRLFQKRTFERLFCVAFSFLSQVESSNIRWTLMVGWPERSAPTWRRSHSWSGTRRTPSCSSMRFHDAILHPWSPSWIAVRITVTQGITHQSYSCRSWHERRWCGCECVRLLVREIRHHKYKAEILNNNDSPGWVWINKSLDCEVADIDVWNENGFSVVLLCCCEKLFRVVIKLLSLTNNGSMQICLP